MKLNRSLLKSDPEEFRRQINKTPFYKTISMEMMTIDQKRSTVRIRLGRKHLNPSGGIHGGLISSLLDTACGLSVQPHLQPGESTLTISLQVEYVAPAAGDFIYAQGEMVHRGRRLARAEAVVMDEKKNLLAKGYASLAIIVRKQGSQEK